jgi:hypothetical protein
VQNSKRVDWLMCSGFFRDMFTLPTTADNDPTALQVPIDIDETAHDLNKFFSHVVADRSSPKPHLDLISCLKLAELARKYDAPEISQACATRLAYFAQAEPYKLFAVASHIDDIPLAKTAIAAMTFQKGGSDIFLLIAGAKPTWQLDRLWLYIWTMSHSSSTRSKWYT